MAAPTRTARSTRLALHTLRVREVERLTDDAVAVTFDVPKELRDEFDFVQGQHVSVRAPQVGDDERRSYSICSPAGSGVLRIGVKVLPGGAFSTYAQQHLRPGDELEVMTPTGSFHTELAPQRARTYGAVAAGSGITPILSLVATTLEREPHSTFTLLYGNRSVGSIMFLEELEDLKNRYPDRFTLVHVLSREPHQVDLFHGRLDRDRLTRLLDTVVPPDVDEWFLCGPFDMVVAARELLVERGVAPSRVHRELFHVDGPPPRPVSRPETAEGGGQAHQVTMVLDGRSSTFGLAEHAEPILDAALKVRADAPYACKGAVCGTCRARLVEGTVRMDQNYVLEPDELAAGFVLACQSHPTAERVTLDFDH